MQRKLLHPWNTTLGRLASPAHDEAHLTVSSPWPLKHLRRAVVLKQAPIRRPLAMVEDMNKAMAWNIAGVGRRTRDAAEEAARRAGMRLDDWLDAAIAEQAAEQGAPLEKSEAQDDCLDAVAGRLERISRRNSRTEEPYQSGVPGFFDAAIERFERRLSRAEAQAARAFELVAQILERTDAARDGDRQALLQAVRGLEAIKGNWSAPAQTGETPEDGLARGPAVRP